MVVRERPIFYELLWWLVTSTIFVLSWRLIARKIALLFGFNPGVQPFHAACCFGELRRGSVSCLLMLASKCDFLTPHSSIFYAEIDDLGVRRGNMGRIIARWWRPVASRVALDLPWWCARHLTTWSAWLSKWLAKQVHFFLLSIKCLE